MKKLVTAALAAAIAPVALLAPTPRADAAYTTHEMCSSLSRTCLSAPSSWDIRNVHGGVREGDWWTTSTAGSRWTPEIVELTAAQGPYGDGYCDARDIHVDHQLTVLETRPTRATDVHGVRVYAVKGVERWMHLYTPVEYLTADKALRTTGAKFKCVGSGAGAFEGRRNTMVYGHMSDMSNHLATFAQAKAVLAKTKNVYAYNVLATAHNAR